MGKRAEAKARRETIAAVAKGEVLKERKEVASRNCALATCGGLFLPERPTDFYCSDECKVRGFYKRNGMSPAAVERVMQEKREQAAERFKALRERRASLEGLPEASQGSVPAPREARKARPPREASPAREPGTRAADGAPRNYNRDPWEGAQAVGGFVIYQGGGRTAWLAPGSRGVVLSYYQYPNVRTGGMSHRYVIQFGGEQKKGKWVGGKRTNLGEEHVGHV